MNGCNWRKTARGQHSFSSDVLMNHQALVSVRSLPWCSHIPQVLAPLVFAASVRGTCDLCSAPCGHLPRPKRQAPPKSHSSFSSCCNPAAEMIVIKSNIAIQARGLGAGKYLFRTTKSSKTGTLLRHVAEEAYHNESQSPPRCRSREGEQGGRKGGRIPKPAADT